MQSSIASIKMISLLKEHRRANFGKSTTDAQNLGQAILEDWNEAPAYGFSGEAGESVSTAQAKFRFPMVIARNVLPISRDPQSDFFDLARARYAVVNKGYLKPVTYLIEGGIVDDVGGGMALVTLNLKLPTAWVAKYPSTNGTDGADLRGTRTSLLAELTRKLSDSRIEDDEHTFKGLPIKAFDPNWQPTPEQQELGYVSGANIETGQQITVPAPDPLSIEGSLRAIMSEWSAGLGTYGLTLLEIPGEDGSASPYWRWVLWKHKVAEFTISRDQMTDLGFEFSNEFTDVMTYDSSNQLEHSYIGGPVVMNENHSGAWLGIKFESFTKPPGGGTLPPGKRPVNMIVNYAFNNNYSFGNNFVIPTQDGLIGFDGNPFLPHDEIDSRDIVLVANGKGSGKVWIPYSNDTDQIHPNCEWDVFVDNKPSRSLNINPGKNQLTWIDIELPFDFADHTITIKPKEGVYSTGWAWCFGGSYLNSNFVNGITHVLSLGKETYRYPDGALRSLYRQFHHWRNLRSVAPPDFSFDVETVGDNHCYERFVNTLIEDLPASPVNDSVVKEVGHNFRNTVYYNTENSHTASGPDIAEMPELVKAGDGFYYNYGVTHRYTEIKLPIFPKLKSVGDNCFRNALTLKRNSTYTVSDSLREIFSGLVEAQDNLMYGLLSSYYTGNDNVEDTGIVIENIPLPLLKSLVKARDGFLQGFAANNSQGVNGIIVDEEPDWAALKEVRDDFLMESFRGTKLRIVPAESALSSLVFRNGFRKNQYKGAAGIVQAFEERFPPRAKEMPSLPLGYRESQFEGASSDNAGSPNASYWWNNITLEADSRALPHEASEYRIKQFKDVWMSSSPSPYEFYAPTDEAPLSFADGIRAIALGENHTVDEEFYAVAGTDPNGGRRD